MTFRLPSLPYPLNALEPHVSAETLELHHARHHRKYVETVNTLLEEQGRESTSLEDLIFTSTGPLFENAAQAWNHSFYWRSMAPPGESVPGGELLQSLRRDFGGVDALKASFKDAALSVFGSGWTWLVEDRTGRLEVLCTKDADCPLRVGKRPLLVCDVWEHAYYLDYKNKRGDYVDAWLEVANWSFAAENLVRLEASRK